MPSYPYYPNARPNADRDELADWTVSDFPSSKRLTPAALPPTDRQRRGAAMS
jgi:hypothetical protein